MEGRKIYISQQGNAATIVANGIAKTFITGKISTEVLHEINVQVFPGELTLLMGPSGSGKTTLLAILSGLLSPSAGEVMVLGQSLTKLSSSKLDNFRLQNCGFVFQGFNLFGALTAKEQILLMLKYLGVHGGQADRRASQALDEVHLSNVAHLRPGEMSGGQNQRVAIARSLVKNPRLIFADEPTSALDSASGDIVTKLLHDSAHRLNATVLVVTHDHRLVRHADRVLLLEDGKIVGEERPLARVDK